jgi:methionyl-tRNA formyltransferase
LIDGPDEVAGVICQADRPAGRGQKLRMPPVKLLAQEHGVPVEQPTKIRNQAFEGLLRSWAPDLIVVAAYGRILPTNVLELPEHGCINVHASLLPKYRGAAPIQWAIARGERETGVTIMQMNEAMDEGDILLRRATPIGPSETAAQLSERLAVLGAEALMDALAALAGGELKPVPQDHDAVTLAPMITKADGEIDWRQGAEEIAHRCRGFSPWPSIFTYLGDKLLKVHCARAIPDINHLAPGTVAEVGNRIDVATGDGTLAIEELQLEGRKRLTAGEFSRSGVLRPGMRLGKSTTS